MCVTLLCRVTEDIVWQSLHDVEFDYPKSQVGLKRDIKQVNR